MVKFAFEKIEIELLFWLLFLKDEIIKIMKFAHVCDKT